MQGVSERRKPVLQLKGELSSGKGQVVLRDMIKNDTRMNYAVFLQLRDNITVHSNVPVINGYSCLPLYLQIGL